MTRRESRELAFILIFERIFKDETLDQIIEEATEGRNIEIDDFSYKLASTAFEKLDDIDLIIKNYSKKWKLNRISKVTLAILRMAIVEIDNFDSVPISVSINEAVELAKKYGGDDDASFINGLLGAYVKDKQQEESKN
mgnify:CR=1 FL=1